MLFLGVKTNKTLINFFQLISEIKKDKELF